MNRIRRLSAKAPIAAALCLAAAALAVPGAAAAAPFSITEYNSSISLGGQPSRQAGEHADFRTKIKFALDPATEGNEETERAAGNVKDVRVDLPPGLIGNPTVAPTCPYALLVLEYPRCSTATQVGIVRIRVNENGQPLKSGVYNLERPVDAPAFFGFNTGSVPVFIKPSVRAGDYGISSFTLRNSQAVGIKEVDLTLWGVPGDPSHDDERYEGGLYGDAPRPPFRLPFFSNPTSCPGTPGQFTIDANSWEHSEDHSVKTIAADFDGTPFTFNGCEKLAFEPKIAINPDSHATASPTGVNVDLTLPQNPSPDGLATAHVRKTVVTLPKGLAISASAAAGIGACSEAQIGLDSNQAPSCPGSSSLGTVKIQTPVLDDELEGEIFLAKQKENPFGSLLAIYLAIKAPGFYIKFAGETEANPVTGQVTSVFEDTPQLPLRTPAPRLPRRRQGAAGLALCLRHLRDPHRDDLLGLIDPGPDRLPADHRRRLRHRRL